MNYRIVFFIVFVFSSLILLNFLIFNKKGSLQTLQQSTVVHQMTTQVWQTAPADVSDEIRKYMDGWRDTPGWTHNFVNDDEVMEHLKAHFTSIDIDGMFRQRKILAYDLFRYSIIYHNGGLYVDSDIEKSRAFDNSLHYLQGCNVVVGIEADYRGVPEWIKKFPRRLQLVQWAFYATNGHRLLKLVIDRVVRVVKFHQALGDNLADGSVMELTGPGIWTDAIIDYVAMVTGIQIEDAFQCGGSYVMDDVCILNINALSFGANHSCHEDNEHTFKLGVHHFLGSWKDDQ